MPRNNNWKKKSGAAMVSLTLTVKAPEFRDPAIHGPSCGGCHENPKSYTCTMCGKGHK